MYFILFIYVLVFYFFFLMIRRPPRSTRTDTLLPYTTLFRSSFRLLAVSLNHSGLLKSMGPDPRLKGGRPSIRLAMTRRLNSCVIELVVTNPKRFRFVPLRVSCSAARSHQYITKSADLLILGFAFHSAVA